MKRIFGALLVAGGLTLSTSVASFAQTSPTDMAKQAITACTPTLTTASGLTANAAIEALFANAEAANAIAETVGEANFKVDELAAASTDPASLSAELTALVTETCQDLAAIQSEYNATIAALQTPATVTPAVTTEQDKTEVQTPEQDKPEVQKPEQEKPEVQKPEQDKPEQEKAAAQQQTEQNRGDGGND